MSSTEQHQKPRNPFDDDAKLEVDPVGALCDRIDWLRDQQLMLSVGTQGIVSGQQRADDTMNAIGRELARLSERQLWVIGMAAAPCMLVLAVGVLAAWHYFHGAFVVSIAAVVP